MVDYTSTLQKLRDIDGKINNINNLDELNNVISRRVSDLYSVLSSNNFFINQDVSREIDNIESRLNIGGTLITEAQGEIARLVAERAALPAGATSNTRRSEIGREIGKLLRVTGGTEATPGNGSTTRIQDRHNDYNNIKVAKDSFNINNTLADHSHTLGVASTYANLNGVGKFGCTPVNGFHFFDENGNRINASSGKYKFKMKLDDGTEGDVQVEGISIVGNDIQITNNLKFTPSNIDYSKPLEITIGGVYENVGGTGINVIHTKNLKINIDNPEFLDTEALRDTEFDNYNNSGSGNRISNHLSTRHRSDIHKLEREALERAMKNGDGPKYNQLSDDQKEQLYQNIRALPHPSLGGNFFDALNASMHLDQYDYFKARFVAEDKDRNKGDTISSKRKYNDFIHNNLESKSEEYINTSLDAALTKSLPINRFLKGELTNFLDRISRNKQDTNVHKRIDSDLEHDDHKMKKGPRSLLYPRDKNYMRFFSNKTIKVENQEVNIKTNTSPEDLNNLETVKYNLQLDVSGKNRLKAIINIDGEKKPVVLKAGNPASLVRRIMKNTNIAYGKVRAHLGFNIYKSMIQMAKDSDISLKYRDSGNHINELDIDENGNIALYDIDDWTNRGTTNRRLNNVVFDQQMFENTNDFDQPGYNGGLRQGIDELSYHFNSAMNVVHDQYRDGIKKRFLGLINSPSSFRLPSSVRLSPLKKLLNARTNTNFDFDTTIQAGGKDINVSFKKNKYTINMYGLKKPISSRDLGKLLRKRQGRSRVFDGIERDIAEGIYVAKMEQLRTNSKIARSSFGVMDDITQNMYVLDDDGNFGVISAEKLDTEGNPMQRKIIRGFGVLSKDRLSDIGYEILDEKETKELMKNPFLMQRFVKAMNSRMGFGESIRALFNK
ncbi:MAG TPA: hypothetical protein VJ892_03990 [Candidatus Absconditabacterales bacterium]|nr:hypothetical protein [Candidatus Absconditabacterales bacterium]